MDHSGGAAHGERDDDAEQAYEAFHAMAANGKVSAFNAFREGGKKMRNSEITAFLARALKTQENDFMSAIEAEIGSDMRAIWTPTAVNCFKRLKGHQLDDLYKNLLDLHEDTEDYRTFAKSKKGEKNEAMHKLFSDPKHQEMCRVTTDQKARIDAWVPDCF